MITWLRSLFRRKPVKPVSWTYVSHEYLGPDASGSHAYAVVSASDEGAKLTRVFKFHHAHSDERLVPFFIENAGGGE